MNSEEHRELDREIRSEHKQHQIEYSLRNLSDEQKIGWLTRALISEQIKSEDEIKALEADRSVRETVIAKLNEDLDAAAGPRF